jgi:transcriptional regulator with XRE-family HTH domain
MPSTRPFSELVAKIPPAAMARAALRNRDLGRRIDLAQLRRALKLSQQQLAKKMRVNQPEVAKIEKRTDMLLSTLAGVLRAMGAELKIVASFPDHDIHIQSLGKLANGNGKRNGRTRSERGTRANRRVDHKPRVSR